MAIASASGKCIRTKKDHPSKIATKHFRYHPRAFRMTLVVIVIVSVAGCLFTRRMDMLPTVKNLRPEVRHQALVSLSSRGSTQDEGRLESLRSYPTDPTRKAFAYFFYVTSNTYACAAIQFIDSLTNKLDMNSTRIDVVVMHTRRVGKLFLHKLRDQHVRTILVESLHADATERTWRESLTKLRVFQDWGYDRVVYIDADAVPMANLDHLFDLPSAPLYAPTAYWLEQPFFASALLVIEPGEAVFNDIIHWARDRGAAAGFDMDILNAYFADSVHYLPGTYTVLNSDFRRASSAKNSLFNTTDELRQQAQVVHFSCKPDGAYGKPWGWPSHDLSLLKDKGFDSLFGELFEDYWQGERALCAT